MSILKNRAQISIFVIVSVILVIGALVLFMYNSDNFVLFSDQKSSYKIKQYVESCIEEQSKIAIDKIGYHGGWLYGKEGLIYTDRSKPDIYNKKAQGLNFLEINKIPYWFYYDDSAEEFKFNIPEYDTNHEFSIQNQVRKYVEDNLERECLRNFEVFEGIYEVEYEPKDIKKNLFVKFDRDKIQTTLNLPMRIKELASTNSENVDFVNQFRVDMENKIYIPYYLALDITNAQAKTSFIEHRILSFLNPYMSSDTRDLLPPFYDFRVKSDFRVWEVRKVEKLVKEIVNANVGLIQFRNTDYKDYELPTGLNSEFAEGFKYIYTKDYLTETSIVNEELPRVFKKFEDYSVTPIYENYFFPSFFRLSPTLGNVILQPRSTSIMGLIPIFFTEYNAVYEMTLPILFEIKNSKNTNDNFVFNLMIESNIDYNTPLAENYVSEEVNLNSLSMDSSSSLICDQSQFVSEYVYLNISDPVAYGFRESDLDYKVGVDEAIINFDCKGLAKCFVGQTELNGEYLSNNISILEFRLPTNCYPGTLEVYKHGHKKIEVPFVNPNLDKPIYLGEYEMPSKKKIDLNIKILEFNEARRAPGRTIREVESGFIIFTSKDDSDIVDVVEINFENQYDLEVELTLGEYQVQGFIMYEDSIYIPAFSMSGAKIPEMDLTSWIVGGIEIDSFVVTKDKLLGSNELTIYFRDIGIPSNFDEFQKSIEILSEIKEGAHLPEFRS